MKKLNVYTPFRFSEEMNPRKILTIGDQILSEHLFAAHSIRNPRFGRLDVLSSVTIDRINNKITMKLKDKVVLSNGEVLSIEDICNSTKKSFTDTSHSQLSSLLKKISCKNSEIVVEMTKIPTNMEALLSIPDFFIYSDSIIPVSNNNKKPSTGPYQLIRMSSDRVELKINKFYPSSLRANKAEYVDLIQMKKDKITSFLNSKKDREHLLAYFGGYYVARDDIELVKDTDLILSMYPNEWVYLIGFNNSEFSLKDRRILSKLINGQREAILADSPLAQASYSVSPSEKSFGLKKTDLNFKDSEPLLQLSKELTIGFRKKDIDHSLVKNLVSQLNKVKNLKVVFFENAVDIYDKADAYCGVQGISAGDPVHHMNFFLKYEPLYKNVVNIEDLNQISLINDNAAFASRVKEIEQKVADAAVIIPIAHFPGVVMHSNDLKPDDNLVGDWGIRAWTYQMLD